MFRNYLKIAWRNLMRHKGYSAINIAGLTVGIAACLLIYIVVQYETSFNKQNKNYRNIYHIVTQSVQGNDVSYTPGITVPAVPALRTDLPEATIAAMDVSYGSQITIPAGSGHADKKFIEHSGVVFIEPQYFDLFDSEWIAGNKAVLAEPNMVVIDKSTAIKYFGDWQHAEGKFLKMDNLIDLKIAGVIEDVVSNSDFPFKVLVSYVTLKNYPNNYNYSDEWGSNSSNHQVMLLMPPGESIESVNARLKVFSKKHYTFDIRGTFNFLQPLSDLHFDTRFGNTTGDHITSKATLFTLSFIGVLIIIMASINFINLTTAQSVGRSKEVGIRKVLGSSRKQLVFQLLGETTMIVVTSGFLALIVAKLALPYLENISSVPKTMGLLSAGSVLFLISTLISVVVLSGIYPALILSGFKPVLAIKNKITAASIGGVPLRRGLVVAQFAISQLLIIGTLVALNQMNFVNSADLGFNSSAVLVIPGYTDSLSLQKMGQFKQQQLQKPQVKSVSFISDAPSSDNNWASNFYFDQAPDDVDFTVFLKAGDADYFKTFGLQFVAGGGYAPSDTINQMVVNETLIKKLGIKNPKAALGKTLRIGGRGVWAPIVGVVKDFKTNSLREEVKPIIIAPGKRVLSLAAIKIQTGSLTQTVAEIQKLWEKTYPEYAYNGYFVDERIAQFYKQENQLALIYKLFAGVAIFISCLGLYGLVSFMAVQRTKEVGIRKVLGASVGSIVYLFSKEFLILLSISFLIAMPIGWYMMNGWLQSFVYRIDLGAGVFLAAILLSVFIAGLTFGYKAITTALVNPIKSLRSE
ncbi:ABC transporter permease [Arcticibacter eurypsychrophilus]|uniref:ABC transporter permease n=1 Tax=Arcticibacter eurypsychrophilus TaxID=1434752 RepID=UPI00084DC8AE|nr:ABC transporter permease [Arcticibacter eurypsychrophilus]